MLLVATSSCTSASVHPNKVIPCKSKQGRDREEQGMPGLFDYKAGLGAK